MTYSSGPRRSESGSAEMAVVIGGFALFAIGLVAVLLVVALNQRSPTPVVASAPAPSPTTAAPPVAKPPVHVAPTIAPPLPSAAPSAPATSPESTPPESTNGGQENAKEDDEGYMEEPPRVVDLQAPWSTGPGARDENSSDRDQESVSARLVREAQERAQAARDERRRRDEERRRAREAASSPAAPSIPNPATDGPIGPRFEPRFPPPVYPARSRAYSEGATPASRTAAGKPKASPAIVGLIIIGGGMFGLVIVCVEWFELLGVTIGNYPFANFLYQAWRLLGGLQSVGLILFGLFLMVAPFFMG